MSHYAWADIYVQTLFECKRQKLVELLPVAERALSSREQEIENSPQHAEERYEISVAKSVLLGVRTHKLGWEPLPMRSEVRLAKRA